MWLMKDVLNYEAESGQGGINRVFYPRMNREQFGQYLVDKILKILGEVFPTSE